MANVPKVPFGTGLGDRSFLQRLSRNVSRPGRMASVPPGPPTNVAVTALAGANLIQFTRSDGDAYVLLWNSEPSVNGATRIDLGTANEYTDNVGAGGVTRYYWLKAKKGDIESSLTSAKVQTTLALGTAATQPDPPPGGEWPTTSDETDEILPGYPGSENYYQP